LLLRLLLLLAAITMAGAVGFVTVTALAIGSVTAAREEAAGSRTV
jgi:hypothetical protein